VSAFHGPQERDPMRARGRNKGARARHRAHKRWDAEARDADTPQERRRAYRLRVSAR
jgi:hypothetical protein